MSIPVKSFFLFSSLIQLAILSNFGFSNKIYFFYTSSITLSGEMGFSFTGKVKQKRQFNACLPYLQKVKSYHKQRRYQIAKSCYHSFYV